ncbi:MAG: hypothetical protein HYY01_03640 [Chloroflexi bacterium]|nr:hypothetical protein [Chloroflexota bacterium]
MPGTSRIIKAAANERTIEVRIRFFTGGMSGASAKGDILPKHAWTNGIVYITKHASHGIPSQGRGAHFGSLMDIPAAIEKVLKRNEIKLHTGRMGDYLV